MSTETTTKPIARFGTLLGAVVTLTQAADRDMVIWQCEGCTVRSGRPKRLEDARNDANDHAATCRALPQES